MDDTITKKQQAGKNSHTNTKGRTNLHGEFLQGKENITRLGRDWDELFARAQNAPAYLSRAWLETFINQNRFRGIPCLIAVWNESKLAALLAFSVHHICGIRIGKPICINEPAYTGLLLDPDYPGAISVVAEVWIRENIAHAFYNKYLSSLDKVTNELFQEFANRGYAFKRGFARPCPWIQLGCSFEEYLQKTKTGKRRKKLRYTERQVMNSGNVEIVRFNGKDITHEVNKRIATIQRESWMKRRGAAILGKSFYQKLLEAMANAGLAHVWLMTIDGDDAAFSYTLVAHGKLDLRWMAFKLKYESSVSFGKILTMQVIRDACEEKIESFNLGLGDSEWKQFWATGNHDLERIIAGRGIIGHLVVLCYNSIWWLAGRKSLFKLYRRIRKRLNIFKQHQSHS